MGFKEKQGRENWVRDDAVMKCTGCGSRFSFSRRRHHCRRCGGVFCDSCSNFQALVPTGDGGMQGGMKRVCQPCYQILRESQKAAHEAAASGGGGGAASDLQYIHVAIGKLRQDEATLRRGYGARVQVLLDQLPKLLEEIRESEQRLQAATLFTGTTHDELVQDLQELCGAYERRRERGAALQRALRLRTLTAFFTTVHTKLLGILLQFVLSASKSEASARCQLVVLDEEVLLSCREVNTHMMRQWEGTSARSLCEAMEDVAEEAALRLTFRWEEQISCLTPTAARRFAECLVARVGAFLQQDEIIPSKRRLPAADLLAEAAEQPQKCVGDRPIELYTRDAARDSNWTDNDMLRSAGIKSSDGMHWHVAEVKEPYKYYYRLGSEEEAVSKGLMGTRQNRNCVQPCFDLERAKERHRLLLQERGAVLNEYVHSELLLGEDAVARDDEESALVQALSTVSDLLRDPDAYGEALLRRAATAADRLRSIEAQADALVEHARDLVDTPEALAEQASYITLQHQLQTQALKDFRVLMEDHKRRVYYSRARLKLLQLLLAHRAMALEALPDFPDLNVAGTAATPSEEVHNAVEHVVASDRSGSRPVLHLLDEASHLPPRWLLERWQEQIGHLTEAGCCVFADCSLARLLTVLPRAPPDDMSPRSNALLGTGTLTQKEKERRAQRPPPPLGPTVCEQMWSIGLDSTPVGQRHVILPTEVASLNWKEHSVVTKCGIMTQEGHKYVGTALLRRHHKQGKYGWARGSQEEAARLGLVPADGQSPPLTKKLPKPGRGSPTLQSLSPTSPVQNFSLSSPPSPSPIREPSLGVGVEVEVRGLRGATGLNGQRGRVCGVGDSGTTAGWFRVVFHDQEHGVRLVQPENLTVVAGGKHFPVGSEVEATGLTKLVALNGARGKVVGVEDEAPTTGRIQVQFSDPPAAHTLKPDNIVLLTGFRQGSAVTPASPAESSPPVGAYAAAAPPLPLPPPLQFTVKAPVCWPQSTLSCTPRTVTAGAPVNCVLVTRDPSGRPVQAGLVAEELRVLAFGDIGISLESEPAPASDDRTIFQFTVSIRKACSLPIAVAARGKCKVSDFVTVVAGPVDFLGRSSLLVWPRTVSAGETMHARIELRDKLSNLATGAGLDDFIVAATNVVELATTALQKAADGTFRFSFVPTEEGDVEVKVGFGGLLKQHEGHLSCQAGPVDFKNTLVHIATCEAEVGDDIEGILVLRDLYGNRATGTRGKDVELSLRAGEDVTTVPLLPVTDEPSEFSFSFECQRRGLTLLEAEHARTQQRVVTKLSVAMALAEVDWGHSTVSLVPREVQAGHTVTCTILARDKFGNLMQEVQPADFTLSVVSSPSSDLPPPHGPLVLAGGTLTCEFEPTLAGRCWAEVLWRGSPKRSNDVTVAAAPLSWDFSTVSLREEARVGESVPVRIVPRDRFGNPCPMAHKTDFQVAVFNEGARLEHTPIDGGGGEFVLTFEPRFTGYAYAEVTYSQRTKESARCAVIAGAVAWDCSTVALDRYRIKTGETVRADIILMDRFGNEAQMSGAASVDFIVAVRGQDGESIAADITPVHGSAGSSRWWFQLAPQRVGAVVAQVTFQGITRSSMPAEVLPSEVWWERCDLRFLREQSPAGSAVGGVVVTRDRFGNPTEVLRYGEGYVAYRAKMSDFRLQAKNYAELDHETLDVVSSTGEEGTQGEFAFTVIPRMTGELRCTAALLHGLSAGGDASITASCQVIGGAVDWDRCRIVMNPPELLAGEKATGILAIKDRFGNEAAGASAADFDVQVENESAHVVPSPLVLTTPSEFRFSAVPTRAGTASATVGMGVGRKESNMIYVKAAALDFMSSTLEWLTPSTFAGDHLEGVLTFRDRFGNPTLGLPPDQVLLQVTNEGRRVSAVVVDDYIAAGETTRIRFVCEPTVRGTVSAEAVRLSTSERVDSPLMDVKPGPVDWSKSKTELPSQTPGEQRRTAQAGDTVAGVIVCRDRFGNFACPGSDSVFTITMKVNGTLTTAPKAPVPAGGGGAGGLPSPRARRTPEDASVYHFEIVPTVAGVTEIEVRYNPEPRELPHTCELNVRPGGPDWLHQSRVALEEREVRAGDTVHFTVSLRDGFGNPTGGAAASMFDVSVDNAGQKIVPSPVEGEGSEFSFTAVVTQVGEAAATVVFQGQPLHSPRCRVIAGAVHFPKCSLELPGGPAVAGETFKALLYLRDRYGNPTSLGGTTSGDLKWTIQNLGVPTSDNPHPQAVSLEPTGPLERATSLEPRASELYLPFVPKMKGSLAVDVLCLRADGFRLAAQALVSGGKPDPRRCQIITTPEQVEAGDTVTVEVSVRDGHQNATDVDLRGVVVSITNETGYPKASEIIEIPGGFRFSFVPVKLGKARVRFKHKTTGLELDSRQITVSCAPPVPEFSSVKVEPLRVIAGRPCSAVVVLRDRFRNSLAADPDGADATIASMKQRVDNGFARVAMQPVRIRNGAFISDFMPTQRGAAFVEVTVPPRRDAEAECKMRSNDVEVRPGPMVFSTCTVVIDEERGAVGIPLTLIVTTKDQFKNVTDGASSGDFSARVINEGEQFDAPQLVGRDKSSTAFCTQFTPLRIGQCWCEVRCRMATQHDVKKSNVVTITT
eukprot:TRINITY_DN12600_c0_g2_i1.p1 TRINITY_DN12600_c0_g2~~TRINITY_DN12600_c0_g2_i1.p1  ORF type:complete len:2608 (+),score=682.15 TRINITY_DN12600_c0_g2_i1:108-7931(+)